MTIRTLHETQFSAFFQADLSACTLRKRTYLRASSAAPEYFEKEDTPIYRCSSFQFGNPVALIPAAPPKYHLA
jgi:hypothetical protein